MAYDRNARRREARAAARAGQSVAVMEPPETPEPPRVGDLLPSLDDLEQVMLGVDESSETVQTADGLLGLMSDAPSSSAGGGSLGPLAAWTTPEATRKGKNFVKVERVWGGQWTTVYDHLGNDHRMLKEDVPAVIGTDLEPHQRRYLRCPKCIHMPNHGIHSKSGPNGCPAREPRLMTYCDVCASVGIKHIIYEDHVPVGALSESPIDTSDPLFRPPKEPTLHSREAALQMKLDDHIRAFHITTARQRGLRKE